MRLVMLYGLGGPLLLGLLLALALPTTRPWKPLCRGLRALFTEPGGRRLLAVSAAILGFDLLQCAVDPILTRSLGYEWTGAVARLEGDLVARVQDALPALLVRPLGLFYLLGYVVFLALPPLVWHAAPPAREDSEPHPTAVYVAGFAANYLLALPFYLFLPVREVAWSGLSRAQPLLEALGAGITGELRSASALDNCIPSLHVSCLVTALVLVQRPGPRGLCVLAWVFTLGTAWAVMALGIHWATDVVVGVLFGLLCALVARRVATALARRSR